jgi:hypothetical protein
VRCFGLERELLENGSLSVSKSGYIVTAMVHVGSIAPHMDHLQR